MLVERGVPATFFPIAEAMRADPAFWKLVVAEGDPIGDHTLTHPQMPTLTRAQQVAEIEQARQLEEATSGAPVLRVFRPPYGAYSAATLSAAAQAGFSTVLLWDTSDRDTSQHGTVAEMLHAAEAATDGSVILMHCGPNATPYVLGPLLDSLAARGLEPVTIPTLLHLNWTTTATGPRPAAAAILDGLSPLPPQSSGGPLVGPSGIGTMTFPPFVPPGGAPSAPASASAPPANASASPPPHGSASAPATATVSPSPPVSPSEGIAAVATPTGRGGTTAAPAPSPPAPTADDALLLSVGVGIVVLSLAIVVVGLARARRRPHGG